MNPVIKLPIDIPGYELLERIGEGTYGTVYRGRQVSTCQNVAIKLLRTTDKDSYSIDNRINRFHRETSLCAQLNHPFIVKLIDRGCYKNDQFFAVFEYVEGETLQQLLQRGGPLPADQIKMLMGQVLEALAYAHQKGIIHRDLKPGNIMVFRNNQQMYAKILDFGMGGILPNSKIDYKCITLPFESLGTPSYASPEQLLGEAVDSKSDLYSWGLIFLECFTGHPVMTGVNAAEIIHQQLLPEDIPLPSGIASHPIAGLLRKVLAKRKQNRTGDASGLFSEYNRIHFDDLVGRFSFVLSDTINTNRSDNTSEGMMAGKDLHQITVLCCSLSLLPRKDDVQLKEMLHSEYRMYHTYCADIASKYGGYFAGALGNITMFFFGYPQVSGFDAPLAVRFVFDLVEQLRKRSDMLEDHQNYKIEFGIGINSGLVHIEKGYSPSDSTTNLALRLAVIAQSGKILLSDSTRERLIHYVDTVPVQDIPGLPRNSKIYSLIGEHREESWSLFSGQPIIGRNNELRILQTGWISVQNKKGKAFLITGAAGIGKSFLINKFCTSIRKSDNAALIKVCCFPEYRNSALYPVFESIKNKFDITDNLDPVVQSQRFERVLRECGCDVELIYPIFCLYLSLPLLPNYHLKTSTPHQQKELLFEGIIKILFHSTVSAPLFVIEDLHWADPTTLEFLNKIIQYVDDQLFMLLATIRQEFKIPFQIDSFEVINLKELSIYESGELLDFYFKDKKITSDQKQLVLERANGFPFFIETLAWTVLERHIENHSIKNACSEDLLLDKVPGELMDLLSAQVHGLGKSKETAQLCSVMGREWDYNLLVKISILDEGSLQADLEHLIKTGIILEKRSKHTLKYYFRHSLLREAAYATINIVKKREYHEAIVHVMESMCASGHNRNSAMLATHLAGAGHFEKAVQAGIDAAGELLGRTNFLESIILSIDVLGWIDQCQESERSETKLKINTILTQAMMGTRGWADPTVKAQIDLSRKLLDHVGESSPYYAQILGSLMTYHYVASNRKELKCISDELIHFANCHSDSGLKIAGYTFSGLWAHGAGKYPVAERLFETVLDLYRPDIHGDHAERFGLDTRVWSCATLALVKWFVAKPDEAIHCSDMAIGWAREINHIPTLCIVLLYNANLYQYMNNRQKVESVVSELNLHAKTHNLTAYLAYAEILSSWLCINAEKAEAVLNDLINIRCTAALSYYNSLLADIYFNQGRIDEAIRCIEDCILLCKENDEFYYEPELYRIHADYFLSRSPDDWAQIEASYKKVIKAAHKQGMIYTERAAHSQIVKYSSKDQSTIHSYL